MIPLPMTGADLPDVLAFLRAHEAQSMFLIANLSGQGLPTEAWVLRDQGAVRGVLGLSTSGMVLPQWPDGGWATAAPLVAGRMVAGLLGPADQVAALRLALGLLAAPTRHDGVEPGYQLDLDRLALPDCAGVTLRPIEDVAVIVRWRAAYETELFATPPDEARAKAAATVAAWQAADSHRVLWQGSEPVALTGFNERLPEVVQVGGVYVPPVARGQGHACRAVGLHLAEARANGVRRALLFAASTAAAKVYERLGFGPAGAMGLVLFPPGVTVPPIPAASVPSWA